MSDPKFSNGQEVNFAPPWIGESILAKIVSFHGVAPYSKEPIYAVEILNDMSLYFAYERELSARSMGPETASLQEL